MEEAKSLDLFDRSSPLVYADAETEEFKGFLKSLESAKPALEKLPKETAVGYYLRARIYREIQGCRTDALKCYAMMYFALTLKISRTPEDAKAQCEAMKYIIVDAISNGRCVVDQTIIRGYLLTISDQDMTFNGHSLLWVLWKFGCSEKDQQVVFRLTQWMLNKGIRPEKQPIEGQEPLLHLIFRTWKIQDNVDDLIPIFNLLKEKGATLVDFEGNTLGHILNKFSKVKEHELEYVDMIFCANGQDTVSKDGLTIRELCFLQAQFEPCRRQKFARQHMMAFSPKLFFGALDYADEQEVFDCLYSLPTKIDVYDVICDAAQVRGNDAYVQKLYYAVYHKKMDKDEIFKIVKDIQLKTNLADESSDPIKTLFWPENDIVKDRNIMPAYDKFSTSFSPLYTTLLKVTFDEIVKLANNSPALSEYYLRRFLMQDEDTAKQFYYALSKRSRPDFRRMLISGARAKSKDFAGTVLRDALSCYELREIEMTMGFKAVIYEPKNRKYASYVFKTEDVELLQDENLTCFLKAIKAWIDHNPNDLKSRKLFDCLKKNKILHLFTADAASSMKDAPTYKFSWPEYTTQHVNDFLFLATPALFDKRLEKIKQNSLTLNQSTLDFYEAIAKSKNLPKQMRDQVKQQAEEILKAARPSFDNGFKS